MSSPVENLIQLQQLADKSGNVELADWLDDGINKYLFASEDLEKALGLKAEKGQRSARRTYLLNRRDQYLRKAHTSLTEINGDWPRSVELTKQIGRFESIIWPRWRDLDAPPPNASELRHWLFYARFCGSLPTHETHIHKICSTV